MPRLLTTFAAALWLVTVLSGMAQLWDYQSAPGEPAHAPTTWPIASRISRVPGLPTLVVFAHPRCPCTRSAIDDLARLLAKVPGKVAAEVRFVRPTGTQPGWEHDELWSRTASIPNVTVASDEDGIEASRFGAATSGQVLLYDADGSLRFAGGITVGRGHEGETLGSQALVEWITAGRADLAITPVFGCHLFETVGS